MAYAYRHTQEQLERALAPSCDARTHKFSDLAEMNECWMRRVSAWAAEQRAVTAQLIALAKTMRAHPRVLLSGSESKVKRDTELSIRQSELSIAASLSEIGGYLVRDSDAATKMASGVSRLVNALRNDYAKYLAEGQRDYANSAAASLRDTMSTISFPVIDLTLSGVKLARVLQRVHASLIEMRYATTNAYMVKLGETLKLAREAIDQLRSLTSFRNALGDAVGGILGLPGAAAEAFARGAGKGIAALLGELWPWLALAAGGYWLLSRAGSGR